MLSPSRERRRYRARMPEAAWLRGQEPRERTTRKRAYEDLSDGLSRYLTGFGSTLRSKDGVAAWTAWAVKLGHPGLRQGPAPDGTDWSVTTIVDYP